ncbi:phosphotransferase family protein [Planomonospora corallina]|uniref:Phosphotransferase family protein n=1 Tax=Planomonospora corallina TaxID=1806052 RepID=A0ABV8I7P7_9ACTN
MTGGPGWQAAVAACQALLGAGFAETTRLSSAPAVAVYRVRLLDRPHPVVVKLYAGRARRKALLEQRAFTALATGCGAFTVPRLHAAGPVPGFDVTALVLDDAGPSSLHDLLQSGARARGAALHQLGWLLAAFHQQPHPPPQTPRVDVAGQVAVLQRRLPAPVRGAARAVLARAADHASARPLVWCHGDLHPGNVLLPAHHDRPHLIDFEQTVVAAAEYDLAQTIVTVDAFDPGEQDLLAGGYGPGLSPDLVAALVAFHTVRGWWWAALREGRDASLWENRLRVVLRP